ncbi:MAG: FAD-dependent oxidoreductase [Clostridium sp.]|uniref:oxidoreductase n=1 Tax=Clostridium sp. TaxID=1506 RepID=UPI003EE53CE8
MKESHKILFDSFSIGNLTLKNRYAMSPVVNMGYCDVQGAYNKRGTEYFIERAKGGVGLIITGVNLVDNGLECFEMPSCPCPTINPKAYITTAREMTERIHAYNSKIFLQLGAGMGRVGMPYLMKNRVAASHSSNRWDPSIEHREITIEEIQTCIRKFGESALIAKKSGFDGVEVHAVHEGYLLDQFAISLYNTRDDEYGGCLANRLRFAVEIVQEIKRVCGNDFPVSLRYSLKSFVKDFRQGALPGEEFIEKGKDTEEGLVAAQILEQAGYDILNVDAGTYDSWYWNHPPMYFNEGMYLPFSEQVKKVVNIPVIVAGRMDNPDLASNAIKTGQTDIVALGRPLLADPYIVKKIKAEIFDAIRPCLSCHEGCMNRISKGVPISCAVNPACGREEDYKITPALFKKKVAIIGGGIAGMEAARVCALRGHEVYLYEKSSSLGGNLIPGGVPSFKRDDYKLIYWYEHELTSLKVNIKLNTFMDKTQILSLNVDTVIISTGSTPIKLPFSSNDSVNVFTADEVLLNETNAGKNIVIIGAGLVGGETALWLSKKGKSVRIIEATNKILGGEHALPFANYDMLKDLLNFNNVDILLESKVEKITKHGVLLSTKKGAKEILADTVITAVGYRSENKLYEDLKYDISDIYLLGDAKNVKNVHYAIWDAYEIARNI